MGTRPKTSDDLPIPDEWISHRADPDKVAAWWAEWETMPSIERRRPAAEVLAEVRGDDTADVDDE